MIIFVYITLHLSVPTKHTHTSDKGAHIKMANLAQKLKGIVSFVNLIG